MTATETKTKKKKLTLSIESSLIRRLDIEAAKEGKGHDRSSIVGALVEGHIILPDEVGDFFDESSTPAQQPDGKASERQPTNPTNREKTTLYLSVKSARRLGLHATWTGEDRSSAVERLIREHIPSWKIYDPEDSYLTTRRKDRQGGAPSVRDSAAEQN
jgi:hypothetical protein